MFCSNEKICMHPTSINIQKKCPGYGNKNQTEDSLCINLQYLNICQSIESQPHNKMMPIDTLLNNQLRLMLYKSKLMVSHVANKVGIKRKDLVRKLNGKICWRPKELVSYLICVKHHLDIIKENIASQNIDELGLKRLCSEFK